MVVLVVVVVIVVYTMASSLLNRFCVRRGLDSQELEMVWTTMPVFILIAVALPSLSLLYSIEASKLPDISVKAIGHQWYWSYEYDGFEWLKFDSYIVPTNELGKGEFRLLEVDNRVILPVGSDVRILVTAADVLHSWTIPSLGVKADAVPGRLNQLRFRFQVPGLYFGQCSEICGANHSFIPIVIEGVRVNDFIYWGFRLPDGRAGGGFLPLLRVYLSGKTLVKL